MNSWSSLWQVNFTWFYFTLDELSVYKAAGESLNVGIKLTFYIAEVGIRKVSQGGQCRAAKEAADISKNVQDL